MSEELLQQDNPTPRHIRHDETAVIEVMLRGKSFPVKTSRVKVIDLNDGGMGGIRFVGDSEGDRRFGETIAEASYIDSDGVDVEIALHVDLKKEIFELEFWKTDFTPIVTYPRRDQILVKDKNL